MHTNTQKTDAAAHAAPRQRIDAGAAALAASAFIILALILAKLSAVFPAGAAYAQSGGADRNSDVVTLTARSSSDASVLLVLDQRQERLYVYELDNAGKLRLADGKELSRLFPASTRRRGR